MCRDPITPEKLEEYSAQLERQLNDDWNWKLLKLVILLKTIRHIIIYVTIIKSKWRKQNLRSVKDPFKRNARKRRYPNLRLNHPLKVKRLDQSVIQTRSWQGIRLWSFDSNRLMLGSAIAKELVEKGRWAGLGHFRSLWMVIRVTRPHSERCRFNVSMSRASISTIQSMRSIWQDVQQASAPWLVTTHHHMVLNASNGAPKEQWNKSKLHPSSIQLPMEASLRSWLPLPEGKVTVDVST